MRPTFLGIGAMRCGTTWLDAQLRTHRDIFLPSRRKELHFFDEHYDRGWAWYDAVFADAPADARAVGEITPNYLYDPAVPARIHADLPDVRLIALLRNPVDRAYSHYGKSVRDHANERDFLTHVAENPNVIGKGRYAEQLVRYTALFAKERLLVLIFEEVMADRQRALATIATFLDLDPERFAEAPRKAKANASYQVRFRRSYALAMRLGQWLRGHDLDRFVNAANRLGIERLFGRSAPLPPLDAETRTTLYASFADDIEALEDLLGRDLACWSTPHS